MKDNFRREEERQKREQFEEQLIQEQRNANRKLENEARLTREAEEKKADELEKIRRKLEED